MPATSRNQRRKPVRSPGSGQLRPSSGAPSRPQTSRQLAPPDYARDYADVRRDLRLIALISVLLFAGMISAAIVL
jgi:hypothetical protein